MVTAIGSASPSIPCRTVSTKRSVANVNPLTSRYPTKVGAISRASPNGSRATTRSHTR